MGKWIDVCVVDGWVGEGRANGRMDGSVGRWADEWDEAWMDNGLGGSK